MQNYNSMYEEKTVIHCKYCISRLRVPTDKGKISIICPACGKQFIYNPNSVIHTVKQIALSIVYGFPKSRKTRVIIITAVVAILIILLSLIFGSNRRDNTNIRPGEMVYENNISYFI